MRALDKLLASIQEPLFRHVRVIIGDEHESEDVLQEILMTVSRRLGGLRNPQWFRAWAYRIATRDAIRYSKRSRRGPQILDSSELDNLPSNEVDEVLDSETVAQLVAALSALPPASQLVIRMHYMEGMSQTEVAEALELSGGTVKSRLSYGLAALRAELPLTTMAQMKTENQN
ncbi:MAG: sigma-70 family RNA polymerase sigma factor [Gemmatimonadales bacterium]